MQRTTTAAPRHWAFAMALYLLGIFMGAIDTGIVTPARTVIQHDLGVDEQVGIWMITIYTLAYAAAIPVMGKLADRMGRKPVYLTSIALFGVGSLACGLAQDVGSFELLVAARALQAVGGGGILPIATAEIGTEVPSEKRGMALGLVGAVYGVANVFGASAGSLILDIVGTANWQWIFYVNVPIAIAVVGLGVAFLPNRREASAKPIDGTGALLLVCIILSLLYGIQNLDFLDLRGSASSLEVWPYLATAVLLVPVLVVVESRAADPVLNLRYFTDRGVGLTLLLSGLSGLILMTVVFVPQFAENGLRVPTGSGGYVVILLGLASGIGAPLSGRLTDAFGPRIVLGFGLLMSLAAAVVVLVWAIPSPGYASVLTSLALFGLGLGFVIGSPLNYMMLERTRPEESSSALATLSLVRSLGTTLAPAIMVGFLAQSGLALQDRLVAELPTTVSVPALPHAQVLQERFAAMKADERVADQLAGVQIPDLTGRDTIEIDPGAGGDLPDDLVELLRTADVTTITERTEVVARRMFAEQTPARVAEIQAGVDEGLSGLAKAEQGLADAESEMVGGLSDMDAQIGDMDAALAEMTDGLAGMDSGLAGLSQAIDGVRSGIDGMDAGLAQQERALGGATQGLEMARAAAEAMASASGMPPAEEAADGEPTDPGAVPTGADGREGEDAEPVVPDVPTNAVPLAALTGQPADPPPGVDITAGDPAAAVAELEGQVAQLEAATEALAGQRDEAQAKLADLLVQSDTLRDQRAQLAFARDDLRAGRRAVADARTELEGALGEVRGSQAEVADSIARMTELRAAVPGAFDTALRNYLAEIDARRGAIEGTFQRTINEGFRDIFLLYAAACVVALALLPLVPRRQAS